MAGRSQEQHLRESKRDRVNEAEYYLGFPEEGSEGRSEGNAPYKLEPNASEIEDFLTRLRQEGL